MSKRLPGPALPCWAMGPTAGQAAIWAGWRVSQDAAPLGCPCFLPAPQVEKSTGETLLAESQSHGQGWVWWTLACYKGKGKLLTLTSFQCRVTLDTAKSFSLSGLTRSSTSLNRWWWWEQDVERRQYLWTWDWRLYSCWNPDSFNTVSKRGAAAEHICSATGGTGFNQIP